MVIVRKTSIVHCVHNFNSDRKKNRNIYLKKKRIKKSYVSLNTARAAEF